MTLRLRATPDEAKTEGVGETGMQASRSLCPKAGLREVEGLAKSPSLTERGLKIRHRACIPGISPTPSALGVKVC